MESRVLCVPTSTIPHWQACSFYNPRPSPPHLTLIILQQIPNLILFHILQTINISICISIRSIIMTEESRKRQDMENYCLLFLLGEALGPVKMCKKCIMQERHNHSWCLLCASCCLCTDSVWDYPG